MKFRLLHLLALGALLCGYAAQLTGRITDASGAVIAGAAVTASGHA